MIRQHVHMKAKVSSDLFNSLTDLKKLNKNDRKKKLLIGKSVKSQPFSWVPTEQESSFHLVGVTINVLIHICTFFVHSLFFPKFIFPVYNCHHLGVMRTIENFLGIHTDRRIILKPFFETIQNVERYACACLFLHICVKRVKLLIGLQELQIQSVPPGHITYTVRKMKFFIKNFFSKYDQIRSFLWIWSYSLKKSLMENLIFCAVVN